jgi:hypothetical protein
MIDTAAYLRSVSAYNRNQRARRSRIGSRDSIQIELQDFNAATGKGLQNRE